MNAKHTTVKLSYKLSISDYLLRVFRQPSFEKIGLLPTFLQRNYFGRVWNSLSNVEFVLSELQNQLKSFSEKRDLTSRDLTSIIVAVKTYIITWITISDTLASLLNNVFNFGFQTKDIKFRPILANEHVMKFDFNSIIAKYRKPLDFERLKKTRNEIVHEGILVDEELNNVQSFVAKARLLRAIGSNDDAKKGDEICNILLNSFIQHRLAQYITHYNHTVKFVDEFTACAISVVEKRIADDYPDLLAEMVKRGISLSDA